MRTKKIRIAVAFAAALFALTACTGGGDKADNSAKPEGGAFAPAPGTATCQEHQTGEPGAAYMSEEEGDTGKVFEMLRHYTAHGLKPFCDGKAPSELDRKWAKLFLEFGADPGLLSTALGGNGQPPAEPMEDPEAAVDAGEAPPTP